MKYATNHKRKELLTVILFILCILLLVLGIIYLVKNMQNKVDPEPTATAELSASPDSSEEPEPTPTPTPFDYINEECNTVGTRFNAPEGYTKIYAESGSFGEYLRNLKLKPYGEQSICFNKTINTSAPVYGVLDQTLVSKDIQQCVDTLIRLWAEYLYSNQRYDEISFDFFTTPVFKCDFVSWASGLRVKVDSKTNKCTWYESEKATKNDYSFENLTKYLEYVYVYANTNSYKLQTTKISVEEIEIGTMIIATSSELNRENPGLNASLGHALIVADIAENKNGERVYLCLEGNTPATQPYIVSNYSGELGGIWIELENGKYHSHSGVLYPTDSFRKLG